MRRRATAAPPDTSAKTVVLQVPTTVDDLQAIDHWVVQEGIRIGIARH